MKHIPFRHIECNPELIAMEQAVLGACMIEFTAFGKVCHILSANDFYYTQHGKIWEAFEALWPHTPIDILTTTTKLRQAGVIDIVGGPHYITSLTNRVASAANIEFHAEVLLQERLRWHLIKLLTSFYNDESEVLKVFITEACDQLEWSDYDHIEMLIDYGIPYFQKLELSEANLVRLAELRQYAIKRLDPDKRTTRVSDKIMNCLATTSANKTETTRQAVNQLINCIASILIKDNITPAQQSKITELVTSL